MEEGKEITETEKIVQEFEQRLFAIGKAERTIASYVGDVRGFVTWLGEKAVEFKGKLTRFYITSYKTHMQEHGYTVNTFNKKINSLVAFNIFLMDANYMSEPFVEAKDKIRIAAGSEKEVIILTEDEVQRILFHIQDIRKVSMRDRAVVLVLLFAGLRVSELVGIKLKNIDYLTQNLLVLGKGRKVREIPLKQEAIDAVKEYSKNERRGSKFVDSEYLFLTQRAGKMDKDTINKILNKIGKDVKIEIYPHVFRRTFCSSLLKKGVPITTVSKLAGHGSVETTAKFYINSSRQDKIDAINLL